MKKLMVFGVLMLTVGAAPAFANLDDFTIESFSGRYELDRDSTGTGVLRVVETLRPLFPDYNQNRGIARYLPHVYRGVSLETEVLSVTDGQDSRDFTTALEGQFVVVESVVPVGSFVTGVQRYDISYTQANVIAEFSDSAYQEFYWDINGTGWPQSFGEVSAEVVVLKELATHLVDGQTACYVGELGSTTHCDIVKETTPEGDVVFRVSQSNLRPFETVTIALAFEPQTFSVATPGLAGTWYYWVAIALVVAGLALFSYVVWLKTTSYKDEPGRPTIVTEYLPPRGLTLATGAHLLGKTALLPLASLLGLATSGVVRLQEGDKRNQWFVVRTEVGLQPSDEDALRALLGTVPAPGERVPLATPGSSHAHSRMSEYVSASKKRAHTEGYYRQGTGPQALIVRVVGAVLGGALLIATLRGEEGLLWFAPMAIPLPWLGLLTASSLALAVGPFLALAANPLSHQGALARDHLKGLRTYIDLAEKDRLAYLQSPKGALREPIDSANPGEVLKLYERLLPWAVLFGLDKQWLGVLQTYYSDKQPAWITSPRNIGLASAFSSVSKQTRSSYQSSSRSGSGGGGSAGGGGGGGGGGGR